MTQMDLLCEVPAPADGRYAWREGISAGGNPYYRLMDRGEETRWWVRHRLNCRTGRPWFLILDCGVYSGAFDDVNRAKDTLIAIKDGKFRA